MGGTPGAQGWGGGVLGMQENLGGCPASTPIHTVFDVSVCLDAGCITCGMSRAAVFGGIMARGLGGTPCAREGQHLVFWGHKPQAPRVRPIQNRSS